MSDEDRSSRSSSDRNRDGIDDDIDRRPGNERMSAGLARREDPRSEQEYSNELSPQNRLQAQAAQDSAARRAKSAREAMKAAQQDVHFFPDVGKFIIPAENTWAAHAQLVLDNDYNLHFNPDKYSFDKIIADKLKIPALTDRTHPDFAKYRGLRTNLEVLRNDIIGMYVDDGRYDKEDVVYVPIINSIAEVLGNALANDVPLKRPFVNFFSKDVANVEAVGAAEMYKFLLRTQDKPSAIGKFFAGFTKGLRELLGMPNKNWGLLPLERTPFSPAALSAPPPHMEDVIATQEQPVAPDAAEHLAVQALALISKTNNQTKPVDRISGEDKAMAVEDGRTILRWLRNLQGIDQDVQDFLSAGTPAEQIAKAEGLSQLVAMYASNMQHNAHLHNLPNVKNGGDAAGGAAMMIAEHAMSLLPDDSPAKALLANAIDSMPETHFERSHQSVEQLLSHMENGLATLAGKPVSERSALDRLLEASDRINKHAKQLRSIETLDAPKREESVELGREILRKLRGMLGTNQPIEDMVSTGRPEEKADLAEQIAELAEIYKNLLAEVLTINPGLADDPRIKAANDAVGSASHGIKLMATKEIPTNAAQNKQIGADLTRDPAEWKGLEGRTMDRLMDSVEGGIEAAASELAEQQQEQQRDEDVAQEAIEASLAQGDNARRKRRRRRQQKSGLGGKSAEKKRLDFTADDYAKGEGIHANSKREKNALNLNANDMAAIKSLGSALRGAGNEAKTLPAAEVKAGDAIKADDKSAAERAIENALQSRRNRNNRGT